MQIQGEGHGAPGPYTLTHYHSLLKQFLHHLFHEEGRAFGLRQDQLLQGRETAVGAQPFRE